MFADRTRLQSSGFHTNHEGSTPNSWSTDAAPNWLERKPAGTWALFVEAKSKIVTQHDGSTIIAGNTQSLARHCRTGKRLAHSDDRFSFILEAASHSNAVAFFHEKKLRCSLSTLVQPVAEKRTALWQWISFTWFNCIGREKDRKERAQAG